MTAAQEQTTSNTEIVKTLIAKGQYTVTPEKASELGLIPSGGESPLLTSEENSAQNSNMQDDEYVNNLVSSLAA